MVDWVVDSSSKVGCNKVDILSVSSRLLEAVVLNELHVYRVV